MARQLSVSSQGSSHLKHLAFSNYRDKRKLGPDHPFQSIDNCHSFPGLTLMNNRYQRDTFNLLSPNDQRYQRQTNLREDFFFTIKTCKQPELLLVALSNDFKTFITDESKHKCFKLTRNAHSVWSKMTPDEKTFFNVFNEKFFTKNFRLHIFSEFENYKSILKPVLEQSTIKIVHHSSVLERLNPEILHLDLYFAILNSVLRHFLRKWTEEECFKNKKGEPIIFNFINVSKNFHSVEDKTSIFCKFEVENNKELVHRKKFHMDKIAKDWVNSIKAFEK